MRGWRLAHDGIPRRRHRFRRIIMRLQLICILLVTTCMIVSARVNAQKVTILAKDASLEFLLAQIMKLRE